MSDTPLFISIKEAFAEAWCLSEHEYHVAGDDIPCVTAKRVAGLVPGGNQLMDYFMVAMDVARVPARTGYVHTYGDDFDGCSECFDQQLGEDLDTGRPVAQRFPRTLCRQPAPSRGTPDMCRWCNHPVSVGEWKTHVRQDFTENGKDVTPTGASHDLTPTGVTELSSGQNRANPYTDLTNPETREQRIKRFQTRGGAA